MTAIAGDQSSARYRGTWATQHITVISIIIIKIRDATIRQTKQKCNQKQSYKTHPLLPETEATLMFSNKNKNVYCVNDNNVLIGRYRLSVHL